MGKSSKRRAKKDKARERRNKKNRKSISTRRELKAMDSLIRFHAPLPEFNLNCDGANSDIKDLVEGGIKGLKEVYMRRMDPDAIEMMSEHTKVGWDGLVDLLTTGPDEMSRTEIDLSLRQLFDREIGNGILWMAPQNLIRRALPISSYTLEPEGKGWNIRCRSLSSRKTSHGRLYSSPYRPTVSFDGTDHQILFTRHAMEQLSDRIIPNWNQYYIGQAHVFGFLYECVYFEPLYLVNGQAAFAVYNSCRRIGNKVRDFMRELSGVKSTEELNNFYYRVGYCPLTLDDGIAVAKTFLTPGYWQTPERRTLAKGGATKKSRLLKLEVEQASDDGINTMSVSKCARTRSAVKWFHEHGVPQVKKIDVEVFRNMVGPYSLLKQYD